MSKNLDIIKMTNWIQNGGLPNDFFHLFNIPYPTYDEITRAISYLSQLFENYSWYLQPALFDGIQMKTRQHFTLLLSDIFGELGVSVKLAGEGFVKYSLRELRAVLDLLFAGIFTATSWTSGSKELTDGVNPFAEAFFSGLWGNMKTLSLDEIILSGLGIEDESQQKSVMNSLRQLSDEFYAAVIEKFTFNRDRIKKDSEKRLKISMERLLVNFLADLVKESGEWGRLVKEALEDQDYFYWLLLSNENYRLRSCKKHEDKLLWDLKNKLGLPGEMNDGLRQRISQLTFSREYTDVEDFELCGYCEDVATVFGIFARPDTSAMTKLIKYQMDKEELESISSCIKESFNYINDAPKDKLFFGDIVYSKLYTKLNNYVHANIIEEPSVKEWFEEFFVPTMIVLQCVLSSAYWTKNEEESRT